MRLKSVFVTFGVYFLLSAFLNTHTSAEQVQVKESGFYGRQNGRAQARKKTKEAPLIQGKEEVLCFVSPNPHVTTLHGGDFRVLIGDFETIWVAKRITLENEKVIVQLRIMGMKPYEFCEIPPEITEFSEIGNLEKYRLKRLTQPFFTNTMVGPNRIRNDFIPKGSFPGFLKQGQIILLRDGKKYLAIKAVDFKPVYNSFDELPENFQNIYVREIYGGQKESVPPIWKSMVYEWSFLQANDGQNNPALAQSHYETQGTSKAPFVLQEYKKGGMMTLKGSRTYFYIPGIDFSVAFWFAKEPGQLFIEYEIRICLIEKAWHAVTNDQVNDIKNPSSYEFREIRKIPTYFWSRQGAYVSNLHTIILRIDNGYVAIRPLKIENDQVVYQWKYWPEAPPTQDTLVKTALNK